MQSGWALAELAPKRKQNMALERETETYQRLLHSELAGQDGRFALIADDRLLGVFDSYNDALMAGYKERQLEPFLVKKIAAVEAVAYFSRELGEQCTQLAS